MSLPKIVFIGSVEFSGKALQKIIDLGYPPVAVITKQQSNFNTDFFDLSAIARQNDIPFRYVSNINDAATVEWIKSINADLICCFGWSSLLKKEILEASRLGVIGFHPSLLPYNRGRHPIIWALALGLKETGCTFFFMDEHADSGDILSQERIAISEEDDARSLYNKITGTALQQLEKLIPAVSSNGYTRKPQIDKGNSWRKRGKADGKIDFRMSTKAILNLVRALTKPYVGAHIECGGKDIIVWKAKYGKSENENIEPGKILNLENRAIEVKCSDGSVWLVEHEFDQLPLIGSYLI